MDRQRAIKRPRTNSNDPNTTSTSNPPSTTSPPPPSSTTAPNTNKPKQKKHKKDHKHEKSKSKSKHKKHDGKSGSGSAVGGSSGAVDGSLESTATKEGRTISQALSTFNTIEQVRFEAFRRCALNASSISNFVAHCLATEAERRFCMRNGTRELLGVGEGENSEEFGVGHPTLHVTSSSSGSGNNNGGEEEEKKKKRKRTKMDIEEENWLNAALKKRPQFNTTSSSSGDTTAATPKINLQDLVAPNNAQEITAVVSTLAKCYAQRLISAARRVASAEQIPKKTTTQQSSSSSKEEKKNDDKDEEEEEYESYPDDAPILPHHLLTAYKYRTSNGLDPGFFLRPCNEFLHGSKRGLESMGNGGGMMSSATCGMESAACGMENKYKMRLDACLEAQDLYDEFMKKKEKGKKGDAVSSGGDEVKDDDKMKE